MLDLSFERKIWKVHSGDIIGIDESGRGPLAGPVVAAGVRLSKDFQIDKEEFEWVKDSKKLTEKRRVAIFESLTTHPRIQYAVMGQSPTVIDDINIRQATLRAMQLCVHRLESESNQESYLLIDGRDTIPKINNNQRAVTGGDNKIFSIAAASIVAKVARDRMMKTLHKQYPEYNFAKHKGYGTKEHRELIKKHGISPLHRKSFIH